MGKGHEPKGSIINFRPTERDMDHHCVGFGYNDANAPFSNTVLCHVAPTPLKQIDWTLVAIS
jgi:hypothetical protein